VPARYPGIPHEGADGVGGCQQKGMGISLPEARAGWEAPAKSVRVACRLKAQARWGRPARSKMVGVWETGEGEQVPPPRQPLPPWRYPHGPAHGENLEKS